MTLAPAPDPALENGWRRIWRRNLLIFIGYWAVALGAYAWIASQGWEPWRYSERQLGLSHALLLTMAVHLLVTLIEDRAEWAYRWRQFFYAPASPHGLAFLRMAFCGANAAHFLFNVPKQWLPLASLPHSARQPLPFIGWLIDILPISPTLYTLAIVLGIIVGTLAAFGLFTRPMLFALIPLNFYLFGVPQFFGKLSHYQFMVWMPMILAFTPCGRFWSLDALIDRVRGRRIDTRPSLTYGLGLRWVMLTLAGIYFFSGVAKLQSAGLHWALSDNPVNLLRTEWLEQFEAVPFIRIDAVPWLCQAAALGVILFELSYPLLLLSPRNHIALALEVIAFHTMNGYFLKIDFTYLKTAHVPYFPLDKAAKWLRSRPRWQGWVLIWGGLGTVGWLVNIVYLGPFVVIWGVVNMIWKRKSLRRRWEVVMKWRGRLDRVAGFRRLDGRGAQHGLEHRGGQRGLEHRGGQRGVLDPSAPTAPQDDVREIPPQDDVRDMAPQDDAATANWLRWSMISGALLLSINSLCGLFGIHSWPFSSYPAYAFVRESTVKYGWFEPQSLEGKSLDLDTEAKKIGFRKENILPMAERIVNAYRFDSTQLAPNVLACWQRWQTEVPALQAADQATVWIRELPLDPDHYGEIVSKTYLGNLELKDQEWEFTPEKSTKAPR